MYAVDILPPDSLKKLMERPHNHKTPPLTIERPTELPHGCKYAEIPIVKSQLSFS